MSFGEGTGLSVIRGGSLFAFRNANASAMLDATCGTRPCPTTEILPYGALACRHRIQPAARAVVRKIIHELDVVLWCRQAV